MKIIGHELGRIIVFFPMEEVRPEKGVILDDLIEGVKNRYKFIKAPDLNRSLTDLDNQGYVFEAGSFSWGSEQIAVREFVVYPDGISVSCLETDHAEAFFEDVMMWSKEKYGFREFVREPRKIYRSFLVLEFDNSINNIIKKFSDMSQLIQLFYSLYTGQNEVIALNRIDLRVDNTKIAGLAPLSFVLERKVGAPHETERYVSEAPFPSQAHIELLQKIEEQFL